MKRGPKRKGYTLQNRPEGKSLGITFGDVVNRLREVSHSAGDMIHTVYLVFDQTTMMFPTADEFEQISRQGSNEKASSQAEAKENGAL